jgi:transposase
MQVYIGIDWSESKHDIVIMNKAGAAIARQTIPHSPEGFLKLETMCQDLEIAPTDCLFGLETAHNMVIDFLWSRNYTNVYVIPPSVVKSTRGRYGQSRARTDQSDALLLADLLRTDRLRLQPWHPDSLLTRQMRAKVSLINYLTRDIVRLSNRLRAVLLRYYPSALHVFSSLRTQIALQFIRAYPTPEAADALSFAQFETFARQHSYPQPKRLPKCFAHLEFSYPQALPETVLVYRDEAIQLATLLLRTVQAKNSALRELTVLFEQHPDHDIFSSLPGAGKFLAPALLVKFGDDRQRFLSPAGVQALAGTCPVTDSSGKRRIVKFRHACDREFRNIAQKWAITSKPESLWATLYWEQARPHCNSDSHAYRCLANRWLAIAWKLWQTGEEYDEAYHLKQRALHSKPRKD